MTIGRATVSTSTGPASAGGINLASVDLNLLVALEALLEQRSVTYAGQRVGLSQPAMSRTLARLRDIFKDDLLVRTTTGVILTTCGEQLLRKLPPALAMIREILTPRSFKPEATRLKMSVAMPEHQALVLLPQLMPRLRATAPDLDFVVHSLLAGSLKGLENGEIDFVVGQVDDAPPGFFRRSLYTDRFVCLLRRGHPALRHTWTADRFSALRHAVIAPGSEERFGHVYDALSKLNLPDRDPLIVPNTMAAPMIVAQTDLVLTVPYRVALQASSMLPLIVKELPVEFPSYEVSLIWHERCHRSVEHSWLRAEIAAASVAAVRTMVQSDGLIPSSSAA